MKFSARNFVSIVLVAFCTVGAFAVARHARAAYDTSQLSRGIQGDLQNGARDALGGNTKLSDLLNSKGLSSKKYSDLCIASNVFATYKNGLEDFADQILDKVKDEVGAIFSQMKSALVQCAISGALKKLGSSISNVPIPGANAVGSAVSGAAVECVLAINPDLTGHLKSSAEQLAQRNFLARCEVAVSIESVAATVDAMIQEQGPGGSQAWATDWTTNVYVDPDEQGFRRFWAELVNTDICGYMKEDILNWFHVPQSYRDNPPNINSLDLRVSAGDPFQLRAACTLPPGYDPEEPLTAATFRAQGGYDFLTTLNESQNNPRGFIAMATAELNGQREAMVESANSQLIAGGGNFPIYGDAADNCLLDADGKCITYGRIRVPPGAVRDMRMLSLEAQKDFLVKTSVAEQAMMDTASRIQARLLDWANQSLPFELELGLGDKPDNFTPAPTPAPVQGSGDPNDPLCTGGNPQCTCVMNDPSAQSLASNVISGAMSRAIQAQPDLFVGGTNQIAPGTDMRLVLQAICDQMQVEGDRTCIPHPRDDNKIVIVTEVTSISIDVLTPDGFVRTNGGRPIAACEPGVQD